MIKARLCLSMPHLLHKGVFAKSKTFKTYESKRQRGGTETQTRSRRFLTSSTFLQPISDAFSMAARTGDIKRCREAIEEVLSPLNDLVDHKEGWQGAGEVEDWLLQWKERDGVGPKGGGGGGGGGSSTLSLAAQIAEYVVINIWDPLCQDTVYGKHVKTGAGGGGSAGSPAAEPAGAAAESAWPVRRCLASRRLPYGRVRESLVLRVAISGSGGSLNAFQRRKTIGDAKKRYPPGMSCLAICLIID